MWRATLLCVEWPVTKLDPTRLGSPEMQKFADIENLP